MGDLTPEEVQTVNLRRQWGYEQRPVGSQEPWNGPHWCRSEVTARALLRNGPGLGVERRLVWRLVSDPVVDHG